ncbi:hypothetical protein AB0M43_20845 [Longispora sp. NPDC051575]|uniref:hypothetical protein n=1 Tax=Longispora sp. NPDC051575 TaxID=3154943 RepID=UPI00341A71CC
MLEFIGVIIMIQGFGSAIAYSGFDNERFGFLLRWATEYQPWIGIFVGLIGLAVLLVGDRRRKARAS